MAGVSRLQISFGRTPDGHIEDVAVVTMHFTNTSGELLDGTQMVATESAFGTFWAYFQTITPTYVVPAEYRWYDQKVWPALSPLLRVQPTSLLPGGGPGSTLPPQCAISCTLSTVQRKRWGRFYMPSGTSGTLDALTGRLLKTVVDSSRNALVTYLTTCKTAGAIPVVWSPRGGIGPPPFSAGTYLPVTTCRVDDIVDIIRSRRWQDSPYHNVGTVP